MYAAAALGAGDVTPHPCPVQESEHRHHSANLALAMALEVGPSAQLTLEQA